ncbi:MAG: conjugal transfer protein TrbI, partial [Alphaproteobacteria bacterium]|nr:conjugal transfer protein TrbI [Alphaproteobacteria bacterium]
MTDTTLGAGGAPKVDPESLVLRASPRRVTRFKRHVVIGVVSALVIGVFAAAWIALRASPLAKPASGEELYNIDRKPQADGLAALPSTYDKVKPPTLGPA